MVAAAIQHLGCGLRAYREERAGLFVDRTISLHISTIQYSADVVRSVRIPNGGRKMSAATDRPSVVFARRVKEIREDRRPRLSQAGLARRILEVQGMHTEDVERRVEIARVMVNRTESGARNPTVDDLVYFAQALEVPPEALLKGSGGMDSLSDLEERMVNLLAQIRAASEPKPELLKEKKR